MSDEQIEFMLTNRVPFGLLTPEEQCVFMSMLRNDAFVYWTYGGWIHVGKPCWEATHVYRLAERPKPKPMVERYEVTYDTMDYAVYGECKSGTDIASICKGFAGYEFADGTVDRQNYRKPDGEMCKYVRVKKEQA